MKTLLLAATSSLALTGFAMAQTTTTQTHTAVTNPAAAAGDKMEDAADAAESAMDKAGNKVDEAVTTSAADKAEDAADRAEDAADAAEGKADAAVTAGTAATATTVTTTDAPAAAAPATTDTAAAAAPAAAVAPDVNAPVLSAENPGMLGSWIMNRRIWTTNQPSSSAWNNTTLTERPADWTDIAKVDDIVLDPQGNVLGYIADIGGFLGLGAKRVLLGKDALHFARVGDDEFYATNFTKEELQALPEFDATTVMK
ncbi:PRC-barrel domain-containing protein [Paracoccus contaminans]|uniref:PRC-barrel domain-containing protein n=1 Tax=Paracoccus contaminans TaxID=1945662 RepID=A0A1W6CUN5_9RHOB|nr:PRC-barrel domain-containing protein [Paracoccus contaminans]ARJ68561.1 hypothetical protein B0A89_01800 [Paracoccus contaminans]